MTPPKCCVPSCSNTWELTKNRIIYYRFPTNEKMKQNWLDAMNWSSGIPKSNDFVCSDHFEAKGLKILDKNSKIVPTIFNPEFVAIKTESDSDIPTITSEALLNGDVVKQEIDDDIELGHYEILDIPDEIKMQIQNVKHEVDDDDIEFECYQIVNTPEVSDNESMAKKRKLEYNSSSDTTTPSDEEMKSITDKNTKKQMEPEVPLQKPINEKASKSDGPSKTDVKAVGNTSDDQSKPLTIRISPEQKRVLIDFVEENYQILFGFGTYGGNKKKILLWKQISTDLNNLDKQKRRSVEQWKRTWQDLKKNIKKKLARLRLVHENRADDEIPDNWQLNPDEKRMADLCRLGNYDGSQTVPETGYDTQEKTSIVNLIQSSTSVSDILVPLASSQPPSPQPESAPQSSNLTENGLRARRRRAQLNGILPPRGQRQREKYPTRIEGITEASALRQLELQETTRAFVTPRQTDRQWKDYEMREFLMYLLTHKNEFRVKRNLNNNDFWENMESCLKKRGIMRQPTNAQDLGNKWKILLEMYQRFSSNGIDLKKIPFMPEMYQILLDSNEKVTEVSTESENETSLNCNTPKQRQRYEWSEDDTRVFLNCLAKHKTEFLSLRKRTKYIFWQKMEEYITKLGVLRKPLTSEQLSSKWKGLESTYRNLTPDELDQVKFPYVEEMKEILTVSRKPDNEQRGHLVCKIKTPTDRTITMQELKGIYLQKKIEGRNLKNKLLSRLLYDPNSNIITNGFRVVNVEQKL